MKTLSFSEKGQRRMNEDRLIYHEFDNDTYLIGVVDGMGGYNDGEKAAEIVKSTLLKHIALNIETFDEGVGISAFEKAHNDVKAQLDEAGATAAIVFIKNCEAYAFWIGDVKIFFKTDQTEFVSKDHTLLNAIKETELTVKTTDLPRLKNTVVKSLGGKSNSYVPDQVRFNLTEEFYGFICSDGVHQFFAENEMFEILAKENKQECINYIFTRCNNQSSDNFSGILFY